MDEINGCIKELWEVLSS